MGASAVKFHKGDMSDASVGEKYTTLKNLKYLELEEIKLQSIMESGQPHTVAFYVEGTPDENVGAIRTIPNPMFCEVQKKSHFHVEVVKIPLALHIVDVSGHSKTDRWVYFMLHHSDAKPGEAYFIGMQGKDKKEKESLRVSINDIMATAK